MIGRTNDNWCEAVVLRDRYQLTELADPTHRWVYRGPVQLQQRRQRRYHRRATIGLHPDRSRPCPPRVRDHLALGATPTTPHHRAHRRETRNGLTVAGQADLATHVLNGVRLPWRVLGGSLIGARGQGVGAPAVMLARRSWAGGRGFGAGPGLCLGFPAFPAWCRVRGSGLGRQLIGGLDRL